MACREMEDSTELGPFFVNTKSVFNHQEITATTITTTGASPLHVSVTAFPPPAPPTNGNSTTKMKTTSAGQQTAGRGNTRVSVRVQPKSNEDSEQDEEPVITAEEETWGRWSWRHVYNTAVFFMTSFYNVANVSLHRGIDTDAIKYRNEFYIPNPPSMAQRASETPSPVNQRD